MNEKFNLLLSLCSDGKVAILMHMRADVDSVSSAYAFYKSIPDGTICTCEEMDDGGKQLAAKLGIKPKSLKELDKHKYKGLVTVDTSAYTLVPAARGWRVLGIIDHHRAEGRDMKGEVEIIDSDSPSTAEIIANVIPLQQIDADTAFALSVGIISDGARFKSARVETFETLGKMMRICGMQYRELLDYAEPELAEEAKVAVLGTLRKIEYVYLGGYIVATSEAVSNESDAASIICEAADVAIIAKWKDKERETRISSRARKNVHIALNHVMAEVGKTLGGAGGGHAKAAGAAIPGKHPDEVLRTCIEIFGDIASKKK